MNRFTVNVSAPAHRTIAAIVALAAGGAVAVAASTGPSPARAAEQVSVQAFTLPTAAYATPLASAELPMAPNPSGSGEWLIVSGAATGTLLDEPATGGTPSIVTSGLNDTYTTKQNGTTVTLPAPFLSLVAADGYTWADADGGQMAGFNSDGSPANLPNIVKAFPFDARDMTADSSGNLYIPDHSTSDVAQALIDLSDLGKSTGNLWTVPGTFSSTKPEAVAFADGKLWFSTDSGQLGSITVADTSASNATGPYLEQVNGNGHTLATGADGDVWAVGGGQNGAGGSTIVRIDPSCGGVASSYSSGLPSNPQITAIASGPDGNILFTESGANAIGELDVATGTITNTPLPAGFQLPAAGADMIATGPSSSGTVFFAAQAAGGAPAVGLVSGLATSATATTPPSGCSGPSGTTTTTTTTGTTPTTTTTTPAKKPAGRVTVANSAKVSVKGVASVKLSCHGAGACSGRLSLRWTRRERVRVQRKTVRRQVTTTVGSARYRIAAGRSAAVSIKLEHVAVTAAAGRRLTVTAKLQPAGGRSYRSRLTLIEQVKRRR